EGLTAILGTPTATIPAWLYELDPTVVRIHPSGKRKEWGSRREACLNSPTYLEHAEKIVKKVAQHFGNHPTVVGWQIDNEIAHEGSDVCICDHCKHAWHAWLEAKYKTIDALNATWGNVFWGRTLTKFEQAPVAREQLTTELNPGLLLDYDRFSSDTAIAFINRQAEILRKHIRNDQFITTNLYMPPIGTVIDWQQAFRMLDIVGYDNYPVWGEMKEPVPYFFSSFILSHIRGLKENRPFSILEQISGFQGHTCLGYRPPEAQMILWTNQAIVHGANRICYFRWRTLPYGQEQLCHGIIEPDNKETKRYIAIKANISSNAELFNRIGSQPVSASACLVYDMDNIRIVKRQYLSKGLFANPVPYLQIGYAFELARHFAPYVLFNILADVRTPHTIALENYKIISLPLYQMANPTFVAHLREWVYNGGTLILGWRCGTRDMNNHTVTEKFPGIFTELAGITVSEFESLGQEKIKIRIGLIPAKGEIWADILEPHSAKVIARYTDTKKYYKNAACITVNKFGNGRVYYLGTSLNEIGIFFLYRSIFKKAGLHPKWYGMGIEVIPRIDTNGKKLTLVLNHTAKAKRVLGKKVPPYGMIVIE
ncbi:MAG: beta-galactosidase, partial [Spirochaetes bacterium]|nr:beta-galactosidase [Spirochaetota bacterium]